MPLKDYLNRIWVYHTNTDKILDSYKSRKGKCNQCGRCCVVFGKKCIFLDKNNRCKIYRFRPTILCKLPPLNLTKGEIQKHKEIECGFYWDEDKLKEKKKNKKKS